jgi:hypothetical protein
MEHLYDIQLIQEKGRALYVPAEHFPAESIQQAVFGTSSSQCEAKPIEGTNRKIVMTEELFQDLKIPYTGKTRVIIHENTLYLGPLVGIFTAGFTPSILRPVGERSLFFAKLLSAEKSVGAFTFVFGARQINWEKGTVNGYFYTSKGWEQIEVPFPNVVYDRLPNRKTENHKALKKIKVRMQEEYLIPWFNPGFFNKWSIHRLLQSDFQAAAYLPETALHPDIELTDQMLKKYGTVFLKPVNGSLGYGLYKIIYSEQEKVYYCRYRDVQQINRLQKFQSLDKLFHKLFEKTQLQQYIIQQGIPLLRINGQTVDFRVHTNKNEKGKWQISAMAAKVAQQGSVTTHLNNGGIVKTLDEVFSDSEEQQYITNALTEAAITISESLEKKINGHIGEIGFDFGIDKNKKIWLFEANSKPGRAIFTHPKLKNHDRMTKELSLKFALYLTEKMIKHPEEMYL